MPQSHSKLFLKESKEKKEENKPHSWGKFSSHGERSEDEVDSIQQMILDKEDMIKAGASKKELAEQEKRIWDAIYAKRAKRLMFG